MNQKNPKNIIAPIQLTISKSSCYHAERRYGKYLYGKTHFGDKMVLVCVPKDMIENTFLYSGDGIERKVIGKDLLFKLDKLLPPKKYLMFELYYLEGLTMKEVGKVLGITEARVSQIHSEVIAQLQNC